MSFDFPGRSEVFVVFLSCDATLIYQLFNYWATSKKTCLRSFRPDTYQAIQTQKNAEDSKFQIKEVEGLY